LPDRLSVRLSVSRLPFRPSATRFGLPLASRLAAQAASDCNSLNDFQSFVQRRHLPYNKISRFSRENQ
jgi:hypothetical protein